MKLIVFTNSQPWAGEIISQIGEFHPIVTDSVETTIQEGSVWEPTFVIFFLTPTPDEKELSQLQQVVESVAAGVWVITQKQKRNLDRAVFQRGAALFSCLEKISIDLIKAQLTAIRRWAEKKRQAQVRRPKRERIVKLSPGVFFDEVQRGILREGELIKLTPTEFRILDLLVSNPGAELTRVVIRERIWPHREVSLREVDVYISYLRRKLGDDPQNPRLIKTVRGIGYRFVSG